MALTWSAADGRFRNERGQFVSDAAVRSTVNAIADGAADRMASAAERMLAGEISLAEWQSDLMRTVKLSHLATATIANGGQARMGFPEYGRAGAAIKAQYQYARSFAQAVADGTQPLNGTLVSRARQYGHAARSHYEQERFRLMQARPVLCRNQINSGESCQGCRAESAKGWVPAAEMVPIGQRSPCQSRCRCSIRYRSTVAQAA